MPPETQLFVELFPIRAENLPPLTAYRMVMQPGSARLISERQTGRRLARLLRRSLPGAWLWAGQRLLTDTAPNPVRLAMLIDALRAEQAAIFGDLISLEEDVSWQASPAEQAQYALDAALPIIEPEIHRALAETAYDIRNAVLERVYDTRAWIVDGLPALSVSVISRLLYDVPVEHFLASLDKPSDLHGYVAALRTATVSGEIVRIAGKVGDLRARLLRQNDDPAMETYITSAADDHAVIRLSIGGEERDIVSDALWLVIRSEDLSRFDINRAQAEKALHLTPPLRSQMIRVVSDVMKGSGLIRNSFTSGAFPHLFGNWQPGEKIMLGSGKSRVYDPEATPFDFEKAGAFRLRENAGDQLRLSLINALGDGESADFVGDFMEAMRRLMERAFAQKLILVKERRMRVTTQANLESGVRALQKEEVDCVLIFLPDSAGAETSGFSDDSTLSDQYARAQIIGRGQPCLIVTESLMHKPEAMLTVIMGVMARAGHTPFILESPLPFCDRVIGLSFSRQGRKDGDHIHALSRIYRSDGLLLRARSAQEIRASAEPPSRELIARMLPKNLIARKRVIIHHEGRMQKALLRALGEWEDEADSTFSIVEIMQRGIPRLYAFSPGRIIPPSWGTTFRLNDREAFVVTSLGGIDGTPQPLHIMAEPPLTIEQAVQSVMTFTLFHHGAITRPRLPVTLHHEDLICSGAERGLLPDSLDTDLPFWL
jgi:hypothetical protein